MTTSTTDAIDEIRPAVRRQLGSRYICHPMGERVGIVTPFLLPDGHNIQLLLRDTPQGAMLYDDDSIDQWFAANFVDGLALLDGMGDAVYARMFDTAGTLVGVAGKAEMLDADGRLPRAKRALLADSVATVTGSLLGTSTTTTYVESAAGVAEGGRTGWTAITVGVLFLAALFFGPVVQLVPGAATAAALVLVGVFMMGTVGRIDFEDPVEAIPAFLAIAFMPLTFSIAEGISVGIISCMALRLLSGRVRQISPVLWIMFGLFVLRYFL